MSHSMNRYSMNRFFDHQLTRVNPRNDALYVGTIRADFPLGVAYVLVKAYEERDYISRDVVGVFTTRAAAESFVRLRSDPDTVYEDDSTLQRWEIFEVPMCLSATDPRMPEPTHAERFVTHEDENDWDHEAPDEGDESDED